MEIVVGLRGSASALVEREDTAVEVGSGSLLVYATPCMIALMEGAACDAIAGALPEGKASVGIALNVTHSSATPVGMDVHAEAVVTAIDKNIITYHITAYDEAGLIGEGEHKRAVITTQKFLDRTYEKL